MKKRLTLLEKRFVEIYTSMKKPNQVKAYTLAGYKCRGRTAEVEASRTLNKPYVKEYLEKLMDRATLRAEKNASDIITELEKLGFANIKDYLFFDNNGVKLKSSAKLTDEQLAAISEITQYRSKRCNVVRFKLHDKKGSLELLGRRFGLFPSKQEITGKDGEPLPPITVILKK